MYVNDAIELAAEYLNARHIGFSRPVHVLELADAALVIVFTAPGALDPNFVVDPPEVRVDVNTDSGAVELMPDM